MVIGPKRVAAERVAACQ